MYHATKQSMTPCQQLHESIQSWRDSEDQSEFSVASFGHYSLQYLVSGCEFVGSHAEVHAGASRSKTTWITCFIGAAKTGYAKRRRVQVVVFHLPYVQVPSFGKKHFYLEFIQQFRRFVVHFLTGPIIVVVGDQKKQIDLQIRIDHTYFSSDWDFKVRQLVNIKKTTIPGFCEKNALENSMCFRLYSSRQMRCQPTQCLK